MDGFLEITSLLGHDVPSVLISCIDIFLVSVVIYRLLLLIRGTRAMQMTVGLGLVFLAHQAAKVSGLLTLFSILDNILAHIVLIVVVVFQGEIRRALVRVGRQPFLRTMRSVREAHVLDEIVNAALALAQKRVGALVVLERDAPVTEFIQMGTVLDAQVSAELIYGIFIPSFENPMHDGALVIRDGRIWQAGAFLPLTSSPKVDRGLGTRHRAAIGISEETDAIVLTVSEERGSISLCFNGNMVRNVDGSMLKDTLYGLLHPKQARYPEQIQKVVDEISKSYKKPNEEGKGT